MITQGDITVSLLLASERLPEVSYALIQYTPIRGFDLFVTVREALLDFSTSIPLQ